MIQPEHYGKLQRSGMPTLAQLRKSEWCPKYEKLQRNRLVMGYYRYGPFGTQNRSTDAVLDAIISRTEEYRITGNDELMVDVGNFAMKEFAVGTHPNKHFESVDDGEHVEDK